MVAIPRKVLRSVEEIFVDPTTTGYIAAGGTVVLYSGAYYLKVGTSNTNWIPALRAPEALAFPYRSVTSGAFLILATDSTITCDTTAGNATTTLPPGATYPGKILRFKKAALSNLIILTPDGAETIDGLASFVLSDLGEYVVIQSIGAIGWIVIGRGNSSSDFFQDHDGDDKYVASFDTNGGSAAFIASQVVRQVYWPFADTALRAGALGAEVQFGGDVTIPGEPAGLLRVFLGGTSGIVDGTQIASITMPDAAFGTPQRVSSSFVFTPPGPGLLPVKYVLYTPGGASVALKYSIARGLSLGFQRI